MLNLTVLHFPAVTSFEKNYYLLTNKYVEKGYTLGENVCYSYFDAL